MFFRREKAKESTFQDRLERVRQAGFVVEPQGSGRVRVSSDGNAALLEDAGNLPPVVGDSGPVVGSEIAAVVDVGYQKLLQTPSGRRLPATADHLKGLQNFREDLREALGMVSLYNESLGTVNDRHLYDRVKDRDHGGIRRAWEK